MNRRNPSRSRARAIALAEAVDVSVGAWLAGLLALAAAAALLR